ncbi:MAG: peptidoglycan bridge formation glycyltransferase FemA/FemB family protein [Candidatus Peribacteraceae bacterium]|nr:peptidoglycan bridge formation glycyltransferase FemA/FemB family protein [Candidatus Peribacteraceae bacterium]
MAVRLLANSKEWEAYGAWLTQQPDGNLWQSLERKAYLEALGKEVRLYAAEEEGAIVASALVAIDRTAFGFSVWEIPRGPVGRMENGKLRIEELLTHIIDDAKKDKCMALFLSPQFSIFHSQFSIRPSGRHVHCEATRILDLTQSEEEILAQMKPKGRYNIRIAEKHGVTVRQSEDTDAFYALVKETSRRDRFTALPREKYRAFLEHLPGAFLLLAYAPGENDPIAGLLGVFWNKKGIYYYGASSYTHRATMAPYALQWQTMRFCKAHGCVSYDLLGIAPPGAPADHPWQGITSFKEKFGGALISYPPEQVRTLRPVAKRLLDLKRRFF